MSDAFDKAWDVAFEKAYMATPGSIGSKVGTAVANYGRGVMAGGNPLNPVKTATEGQAAGFGITSQQQSDFAETQRKNQQAAKLGEWQSSSNMHMPQEIPNNGVDDDGDGVVDEPPTIEENQKTVINPNTGQPAEQTTTTTVVNPTESEAATVAAANSTASDGTNPAPAPSGGTTQQQVQPDVSPEEEAANARANTRGGMARSPLAFLATGGLANVAGAAYNWNERRQGRNALQGKSIDDALIGYWDLQKARREIREYNTTEAIRFAYE